MEPKETATDPEIPSSRKPGVVTPHEAGLRKRLLAASIVWAIRLVGMTVRWSVKDDSGYFANEPKGNFIFSIWHNRLSLSILLYRRFILARQPQRKLAAMVSASRDGGFLTQILRRLEVRPARGSTSRRGPQALRELLSASRDGCDLAITPDGPRGPRYQVQEGVIAIAQLTGLPIVPVSYRLGWKWTAGSWDRFQIPLPFTRCDIHVAEPIHVPRDTDPETRRNLRETLQFRMQSITQD